VTADHARPRSVEFIGSFPDPLHPLDPALPEIAVIGRSNVGKSTLINAFVGQRVARTSRQPGKTQMMNVFRLPGWYLLDLPGYGFARVSKAERGRFRRLVDDVVGRRPRLSGVLWLLDVRHPPSADDLTMRSLLAEHGRPTIVALTKADKLSRSQQLTARRERARELEVPIDHLLLTSGARKLGIGELAERLDVVTGRPA